MILSEYRLFHQGGQGVYLDTIQKTTIMLSRIKVDTIQKGGEILVIRR